MTRPPTFGDAKARVMVRLADGREGRLLHVGKFSGLAKVVVGGRHVRVPAVEVEVVDAIDGGDLLEIQPD